MILLDDRTQLLVQCDLSLHVTRHLQGPEEWMPEKLSEPLDEKRSLTEIPIGHTSHLPAR